MTNITDIRIYKIEGTGNLKAFVTVTFDNSFAVHGIKIMEGDNGLWINMPASRDKKGEFKDIFHPVNKESREILVTSILDAYTVETTDGAPVESEF
jgi:stage V sporulation protein G|tara:strand:- start:15101 stop:15388 length:288 start_codon:yes stop_codon:yes gene_type:complete